MKRRDTIKRLAYFTAVLLLMLIALYSGLRILESTFLYSGEEEQPVRPSKTISRNGVDYFPRQDIAVIMVMGIDQNGPVKESEAHINPGAADVVMLLIFDERNESWSILQLNRDTMLEMPALGINGKPAGTFYGQLALAHTYGSGLEDSCENIRQTVSDFLYGLEIDYYVSMNLDAISLLNDAVGGVTVTVKDDFSQVDPSIKQGIMTLNGEQAIKFIQSRHNVGDQMNISRMERQKEYVNAFMEVFREKATGNDGFLLETLEEISDYIVTDCLATTMSSLLDRYSDYELLEIVSPEGESVKGEQYMEFYVDENLLDALILRLFYAPKNNG